MTEPKITLGMLFKSLLSDREMKTLGLPSQRDLAKGLGVDESHISKFLAGKRNFTDEKLIQLIGLMPEKFQVAYWQKISQQYKLAIAPDSNEEGGRGDEQKDIRQVMQLLLEVHTSVKNIEAANVPMSLPTQNRLIEMIAECIAGKTDEELKARIEFLSLDRLDWESFQAIAKGKRCPKNSLEVSELMAIADDEGERFPLDAWFQAAGILVIDVEENGQTTNLQNV